MKRLPMWLSLAWGAILVTFAAGSAQARPPQLRWQAPEGCPQQADVQAELARLVGDQSPEGTSASAQGTVVRLPNGEWEVLLTTWVEGVAGERELRGRSCVELARATALVIALMTRPVDWETNDAAPIADEHVTAGSSDPSEADAERGAPSAAGPDAGGYPHEAAGPERAPALGFRAGIATASGEMPGIAAGAEGDAILLVAPINLELRFAAWLPKSKSSPSEPSVGADFRLLQAGAGACISVPLGVVGSATCAGVRLSRLVAKAFGVPDARAGSAVWLAVFGEQALGVPLNRNWSIRAALQLAWATSRPVFVVENLEPIHRVAALPLRGTLGAEVLF